MKQSTPSRDLLQSQTNVEEIHNKDSGENKPLIDRRQIEGTPFWIIGSEEKGYCLVMGKWKITQEYDTIPEVELQLKSQQWQLILRMIGIICEDLIKTENNTKQS